MPMAVAMMMPSIFQPFMLHVKNKSIQVCNISFVPSLGIVQCDYVCNFLKKKSFWHAVGQSKEPCSSWILSFDASLYCARMQASHLFMLSLCRMDLGLHE